MTWRFEEDAGARPAVLLAGLPPASEQKEPVPFRQLLEIEEAILSFARAALAAGRPIALPGDSFAAPLVARVAAEYAPAAQAEEVLRPPSLVEVLLDRRDLRLEGLLGDLSGVGISTRSEEVMEGEERHPLTAAAVEEIEPWSAVMIGGFAEMPAEAELLQMRGVPIHGIGPTLTGPGRELRGFDVVDDLLAGIEWDEREGSEGGPREDLPWSMTPYPFLMQRLFQRERGDETSLKARRPERAR
jgi:hypothetical protein